MVKMIMGLCILLSVGAASELMVDKKEVMIESGWTSQSGDVKCEVNIKEELENQLKFLEGIEGITSQNKVLEVQYEEGICIVNLARQTTQYGGGSYLEVVIGATIMGVVFENTEADVVSILVEGQKEGFPEGSDYSHCTREQYELYYKDYRGEEYK